jgi:quercetin dioxygenase-like cupin family protein
MFNRDIVPSRLGGRYVASEISIGQGGEVADWLHFHEIALQILYVRRGWVRVVYEDQGQPFVMSAGDVVLQPPGIRHQVLECSGSLKVVEITAPALHATFAEHELRLPNGNNPARVFGTQHFLHHVAAQAPWTPFRGGEAQETSMATASCGLADLRTLRPRGAHSIEFPAHRGELVFGFVLDGSAVLEFGGMHGLDEADAFVIPPGESWRLSSLSKDFRLLHLTTNSLRDGPVATPLHSAATVSTRQN